MMAVLCFGDSEMRILITFSWLGEVISFYHMRTTLFIHGRVQFSTGDTSPSNDLFAVGLGCRKKPRIKLVLGRISILLANTMIIL
jgi:hypothetical protein